MELQDVIRKRRMVRTYDLSRPIPRAIIDRLLENAVRAPSAGFSQGWAFLVLDDQDDIGKFPRAVTPEQDAEEWLAANVAAPTYPSFRAAFGVPDAFTPIGAVSFGYSDEPARDLRARRRRTEEVVHWRRWAS
jgi:nitroreductase